MKILGICGSLRKASTHMGMLRAAKELAPEGVEFSIADISALPIFNQDVEAMGEPEPVTALKKSILGADALFFACTENNFSMAAAFKNALDWASRNPNCFDDKPCTVISGGGGAGGALSAHHFRQSAVFLNLHVLNKPILQIHLFDGSSQWDSESGDIKDEKTRGRIKNQVEALITWAERINGSRKPA